MFTTSWYDQFNRLEYFICFSLVGGQAGVTGHGTTVCNRGRGCTHRSTKSHVVDMLCIVQSANALLFRSYYKTCSPKCCTVAYVFNLKRRQNQLLQKSHKISFHIVMVAAVISFLSYVIAPRTVHQFK